MIFMHVYRCGTRISSNRRRRFPIARVVLARHAGFCFGVRRAVETARQSAPAVTLGPIIHNPQVVESLAEIGVRTAEEPRDIPAGSRVVIRSHGVARGVYEALGARGCEIVDATCPFVSKIHGIVSEKSTAGHPVVIIGSPDHPEVRGICGWVKGPCAVVETKEDAERLNLSREKALCVVSQTTFNLNKFQELVEIIKQLGYHVVVTNTICNATQERQEEALALAKQSDTMIVIGGRSSSNTQKLYEICRSECKNTYYIQDPDDLAAVCFQSDSCVGITAGASTPNTIIQEVSLKCQKN